MSPSLDDAFDLLARTPATLRSWLAELPHHFLHADEGPDTFSPHDVLAHLVQGEEEDWVVRARIILEHGEERAFDPFDRFAFRERYAGRETSELLARFDELRRRNLSEVRALALGPDELARRGTHPELGPVTLGQLLATWTVHDQAHLAQIARVMAKRVGDEVGPWKAYIGVLNRP